MYSRIALHDQGAWTRCPSAVPSTQTHSVILLFCEYIILLVKHFSSSPKTFGLRRRNIDKLKIGIQCVKNFDCILLILTFLKSLQNLTYSLCKKKFYQSRFYSKNQIDKNVPFDLILEESSLF